MSAEPNAEEEAAGLDRFETGWPAQNSTITAVATGLWWTNKKTEQDAKIRVEIEYQPKDWIVYPETLVAFLKEFDVTRPEPMANEIWNELAQFLYDGTDGAEGSLKVDLYADTQLDAYHVEVGEVETR